MIMSTLDLLPDLQDQTCIRIFVDARLWRAELNCSCCRHSARLGGLAGKPGQNPATPVHTGLVFTLFRLRGCVAYGLQEFEFGV